MSTGVGLPDDWIGRIRWLWTQDDAVPDEDPAQEAWRRIFGGPIPGGSDWVARVDRGDADAMVDALGRVYESSYPGACRIGVVAGSSADRSPGEAADPAPPVAAAPDLDDDDGDDRGATESGPRRIEIDDEGGDGGAAGAAVDRGAGQRRIGSPLRWSPGQEAAIRIVSRWMRSPSGPQVLRLFGPAGTGKTTLVRELTDGSDRTWLYASFTGKAALVMRQKGCAGAGTIHSLIYRPEGERGARSSGDRPRFRLWAESPLRGAAGVVIDECSMVDSDIGRDLLSFGRKILVCGDPDQLPPIAGGGFFTSGDPDVALTEVHRQARDSGVLDLATHVREGGDLLDRIGWAAPAGDCEVVSRGDLPPAEIMRRMVAADQVIVGTNRTRHAFNDRHRRLCRIGSPFPITGDRVICLRNERETGLLNGSMWRVRRADLSADRSTVDLDLLTEDGTSPGEVTTRSWTHHFLGLERRLDDRPRMAHQEFDFGYAVTCHKAQGSQWGSVVLYDESRVFDRDTARRWLYTGITRAASRLTVVV